MCARRFLLLIFWLTLIAVAGAFAMFQWGGRVLTRTMTPQGHYDAPPPASGPDYDQAENWIARPGLADDPSHWLPVGVEPDRENVRKAAVFFLHPTTYLERDRWNASLDDPQSRKRADLFVRSQSSAFNQAGEVWAPRYRQAAFGAFLLHSRDAAAALDLAYLDVARAFDHFIAKAPPGRPIILAGHSQGALHLARLMREKVAGSPLAKRIVAAYVVGWPLSIRADLPAMGLPECRTADEARCIASWQSFAEPANVSLITDAYEGTIGPKGIERRRADMLCTNPISGALGGAAAPRDNPGTLRPSADLASATLEPGKVGARCEDGFLLIDGEIPMLGPFVLPGNNYHVYDYALFWGAVRRDVARRTVAFSAR